MEKKVKALKLFKNLPTSSVFKKIESPLGLLTLMASDKGLHGILWDKDWQNQNFKKEMRRIPEVQGQRWLVETENQLTEYFAGQRRNFDIPLILDGTDFQKRAWRKLQQIPYGKTVSYQKQALSLGDKNKVRAVGGANGCNPISIVVPCHRVIAKDGSLGGFGGGLPAKTFLIEHESRHKIFGEA